MHCQLEYVGEVSEVAMPRKIQMRVEAIAIGPVQRGLEQMNLGSMAEFAGFLAPKTLRNQRLVFHITHIQLKD